MNNDIILSASNLSKSFNGLTVVHGVDLEIKRGSIHALIGPNGAGKTTLFNLLTRFLPATSGTISFQGNDISSAKSADVARLGMVRSFQISAVFSHLSVLENVRVALQRKRTDAMYFWRSDKCLTALNESAMTLVSAVGLESFSNSLAVELSYGRKRALEIATTLALDPTLMLLDEPTAGMGQEDIERTVALIRRVSSNRTILMVEHNLGVVRALSDEVTVLARGKVLARGDYDSVADNPLVAKAYLGVRHA